MRPKRTSRKVEVDPASSPINRFGMLFWACVLLVVSIVSGWTMGAEFFDALKSSQWPSVVGTITQTGIRKASEGQSDSDLIPDVTYAYSVNGRAYSGDRIATTTEQVAPEDKAELETRYAVGLQVTVFYDPANPASAYLRPGLTLARVFLTLIPPVLLLAAAGLWLNSRPKAAMAPSHKAPQDQVLEDASTEVRRPAGCGYDVQLNSQVRWLNAGFVAVGWWFGTCLATVLILQEFILPEWEPPQRALLAALMGLAPGAVAAINSYRRSITGIAFDPDVLAVETSRGRHSIPYDQVRAAVAVPGLSLDGGKFIVFKGVAVLTPTEYFEIRFNAELNAVILEGLIERSPNCWAVSFDQVVSLPRRWFSESREPVLKEGATRLLRHFRGQAKRLMGGGITIVMTTLLGVIVYLMHGEHSEVSGQASLIAGAIAGGGFLVWRGIKQQRLAAIVDRAIVAPRRR